MAPSNDTPDPTVEAIANIIREEAVSSPNLDGDTLAGRIAAALPATQAASSDATAALDRANERIAELTAQCSEHVETIDRVTGERDDARKAQTYENPEHDTGPGGDLQQTGPGQTDVADGSAPAIGGTDPS